MERNFVCSVDPPWGLVFISPFCALDVVVIGIMRCREYCSFKNEINVSICLTLGVSRSLITCEVAAALSSYVGVGTSCGMPMERRILR